MGSDKSTALRRRVNASLRCSACPGSRRPPNEKPSASPLAAQGHHRQPAITARTRHLPHQAQPARHDLRTRSGRVYLYVSLGFQQLRTPRGYLFNSCRVMCIMPCCITDSLRYFLPRDSADMERSVLRRGPPDSHRKFVSGYDKQVRLSAHTRNQRAATRSG